VGPSKEDACQALRGVDPEARWPGATPWREDHDGPPSLTGPRSPSDEQLPSRPARSPRRKAPNEASSYRELGRRTQKRQCRSPLERRGLRSAGTPGIGPSFCLRFGHSI